jgi:hypothetical protein
MQHEQVIAKLNKNAGKIAAVKPQVIPFKKHLKCYELLLVGNVPWGNASKWLADKTSISRADIKTLADECKAKAKSWPTLFVISMIWGYGERDDSGPVKLYFALNTNNAEVIINETAEHIAKGNLKNAFVKIQELNEIGGSFGSKFLFAVGQAYQSKPQPLVLDSKLIRALCNLWGYEADKLFNLKEQSYNYRKGRERAALGYVAYCDALQSIAQHLTTPIAPEILEQFLFENPDP